MKKKERGGGKITFVLLAIFVFICAFLALALRWGLTAWGDLTMDQIVIQLSLSVGGTSSEIINSFVFQCVLPAVAITALLLLATYIPKPRAARRWFRRGLFLLSLATLIASFVIAWIRFDASSFFFGSYSTFVEDNYADPHTVRLTFPEKKRNLIYIYLESMETTSAGIENGGAFPENYIPELTRLAQENEDFSGDDPKLNGGASLAGSGWTIGAMVAQSSGLPMKYNTNDMNTQKTFFPSMRTLGDILRDNGYQQTLMFGSDANFGGRRQFFREHGKFRIKDFGYAKKHLWVASDYCVWWGYEDEKLFQFAREELLRLSRQDKPFNLTLLTADTHFPDGLRCRLCGDEFGDDQYANAMACSSRQVSQFVEWIQQQDFYEDTAIVLCGDHPTMDPGYCASVPSEYPRKTYTAFINAAAEPALNQRREYATMDMFPTTLSALGVKIEGNRLGLGTDLFSDTPTLSEIYGCDELDAKLTNPSKLLDELQTVKIDESIVKKLIATSVKYDDDTRKVRVIPKGAETPFLGLKAVYVDGWEEDPDQKTRWQCELEEGFFCAKLDAAKVGDNGLNIEIIGVNEDKQTLLLDEQLVPRELITHSCFRAYLDSLVGTDKIVLMGIKDEGTHALREDDAEVMAKLGLQVDLRDKFRHSYLAVVDNGSVIERLSTDMVEQSGVLSTGASFLVRSACFDAGDCCAIEIDGVDYSPNERGMNIVVVDSATGSVADAICFDTYFIP